MGRVLFWSTTAVVSGLAGWSIGTYGAERRRFREELAECSVMSRNPEVQKFILSLQAKGYRKEETKPSIFLELHKQYMFTRSVLSRENRLHPEGPIRMLNPDSGDMALIFHVGEHVASKDHFAAACTTIFDEGLAEASFARLPNKVGVTGTLKLSPIYRYPQPDSHIVLFARPTTAKGRRSEAEGELVSLDSGKTLASGQVIMIEPWWGKYISYLL